MASNDTKESGFSDEEDGAVTADGHRSARVLHDTDQSAGSINVTTEDDEDLSPFEAQTEATIVPPEWIGNIRLFDCLCCKKLLSSNLCSRLLSFIRADKVPQE